VHGTAHGSSVVEHLVYGHCERIFMAENDHRERIANENEIDSCLVDQARSGVVVGCECRDREGECRTA
jgi:hypothetical protein